MGFIQDLERRIDEEKARAQQRKNQELLDKAKRESERAKRQNSTSILW